MESYHDARLDERIAAQLAANGLDRGPLTAQQLFGLDQFHVGGPAPIQRLIGLAAIGSDSSVLDLGCGIGGTARLVAATTGARVLGIDLTAVYVDAGRMLNARCGQTDRIEVRQGDVTELATETGQHDAALLVHVQMNVADKTALFEGARRALKPGGKLLLWEICAEHPERLRYPMPWSLDGTDSHVVPARDLRAAIEAAGLTVDHWSDRTEWAANWAQEIRDQGPPAGPSLPAIIHNGPERLANLLKAIAEGQVTLIEGAAHV